MAKIYPKDGKWYANYKDALKAGKWRGKLCLGENGPLAATEDNRKEAQAFADELEKLTTEKQAEGEITFKQWTAIYLAKREKDKGPASAQDVRSRYENHLTHLDSKFLSEIKRSDLAVLADQLLDKKSKGALSVSGVWNVYFALTAILGGALDIHIEQAFWKPAPKRLKDMKDADSSRAIVMTDEQTERFTDPEVHALLTCDKIPADRRVVYALSFMTGMRSGEVSAVRFNSIKSKQPLNQLWVLAGHRLVKGEVITKAPKNGKARLVPVIAQLKTVLDEWWATGYRAAFGEAPTVEGLIVPKMPTRKKGAGRRSVKGALRARKAYELTNDFERDLEAAGVASKGRTLHTARHTFISILDECGARRSVTHPFTHHVALVGQGESAVAGGIYTHGGWQTACTEASKWTLTLDTLAPAEANALPPSKGVFPVVNNRPAYYEFTTEKKEAERVEVRGTEKSSGFGYLSDVAGVAQLVEQRFCNSSQSLPATSKHAEIATESSERFSGQNSEFKPTQDELTTVLPPVVTGTSPVPATVLGLPGALPETFPEPVNIGDLLAGVMPSGWHEFNPAKGKKS